MIWIEILTVDGEWVRRVSCDLFNETSEWFNFDHFNSPLFSMTFSKFVFFFSLSKYCIMYIKSNIVNIAYWKKKHERLNKTYDKQNGEIRWIIQCVYMVIARSKNTQILSWKTFALNKKLSVCIPWRFVYHFFFLLLFVCANSAEFC